MNAEPDWPASRWNPAQGGTTLWKNLQMPDSMMESWPMPEAAAAEAAAAGFQSTQLFDEK